MPRNFGWKKGATTVTATKKAPAIETYREAVSQLTDAVNALDQAHSMLRDMDLHNSITAKLWGRYVSLGEAVNLADNLLRDAQNITCDNCGKPMAEINECLEGTCQEGPNNG
jgi:hypothetical protein